MPPSPTDHQITTSPNHQIGNLLRLRRQSLHLTLSQLAASADCSKAYLSAIENNRLTNPPSTLILQSLEQALSLTPGHLTRLANLQRISSILQHASSDNDPRIGNRKSEIGNLLLNACRNSSGGGGLDSLYRSGALHQLLNLHTQNIQHLSTAFQQIPLINKVAAGYPADFTDLDYPARIADEYISLPKTSQISDLDIFAATVVGQSMLPDYAQGDLIIFDPAKPASDSDDCFIRLLPDHHTTFKRIFFETHHTDSTANRPSSASPQISNRNSAIDNPPHPTHIRLQPLNPAYQPQTIPLTQVSGLYPAIYRLQSLPNLKPQTANRKQPAQ